MWLKVLLIITFFAWITYVMPIQYFFYLLNDVIFFYKITFVAKNGQELVSIVWVQCYPNQISQAEDERGLLLASKDGWIMIYFDLLYKPFLPKREIAVL